MPAPKIVSVDLLEAPANPESGETRVRVSLDDGREPTFIAATFDRPGAWTKARKGGFSFSDPVLHVRRLDAASVRAAVDAMAAELGGFWLRYYRAAPGAPTRAGLGTARLDRAEKGAAVVEAVLKDGREFSMLAAEPVWWREELSRRGLAYYFGPQVLFLAKLDAAHARAAARAMAEADDQLFCRYDTPRKTLPEVLDAFAAARRPKEKE
jgi:hypothetical protein